jgi:predicted dienelactone hydrolase
MKPTLAIALLVATATHVAAAERDPRTGAKLHATAVVESIALSAPTTSGFHHLRIVYPTDRGRFPLIVLSQGARSAPGMYSRLANHWAARGYVVLQPVPPELAPIGSDPRSPAARRLPASIDARIAEIANTLAGLDQIEARVRALRGRFDRERIALAGHSIGALAALLAAGPRLTYAADGARVEARVAGVDAVVLIGDPSRTGIVPPDAWRTLEQPSLLATGTADEGEAPSGSRPSAVFALGQAAAPTARHELNVRGMDVCLGGVLCRAPPGTTADLAALAAIAESSTAFFDAYLRSDPKAAEWLRRDSAADFANGRAKLTLR